MNMKELMKKNYLKPETSVANCTTLTGMLFESFEGGAKKNDLDFSDENDSKSTWEED